jgi:hypothetical protein
MERALGGRTMTETAKVMAVKRAQALPARPETNTPSGPNFKLLVEAINGRWGPGRLGHVSLTGLRTPDSLSPTPLFCFGRTCKLELWKVAKSRKNCAKTSATLKPISSLCFS